MPIETVTHYAWQQVDDPESGYWWLWQPEMANEPELVYIDRYMTLRNEVRHVVKLGAGHQDMRLHLSGDTWLLGPLVRPPAPTAE